MFCERTVRNSSPLRLAAMSALMSPIIEFVMAVSAAAPHVEYSQVNGLVIANLNCQEPASCSRRFANRCRRCPSHNSVISAWQSESVGHSKTCWIVSRVVEMNSSSWVSEKEQISSENERPPPMVTFCTMIEGAIEGTPLGAVDGGNALMSVPASHSSPSLMPSPSVSESSGLLLWTLTSSPLLRPSFYIEKISEILSVHQKRYGTYVSVFISVVNTITLQGSITEAAIDIFDIGISSLFRANFECKKTYI